MSNLPRSVRFLWNGLGLTLIVGAAAYAHFLWTGSYDALTAFFATVGFAFLVASAGAEVCYGNLVRRQFDYDEPMYAIWTLIFLGSSCRFVGILVSQLYMADPHWNPLAANLQHVDDLRSARSAALVLSGPVSMALLAAALAGMLRLMWRLRILRSVTRLDMLIIGAIAVFTLRQLADIFSILVVKRQWPGTPEALLWFSDPLLTVLLVEALLIRRTVLSVGFGLVAAGWSVLALGIALTGVGDLLMFAGAYSYLTPELIPLSWFIWLLHAAAFASAPCFQIEAIRRAVAGSYSKPPSVVPAVAPEVGLCLQKSANQGHRSS